MAEESAFNEQLEELMKEEGIPSKEKLLEMLEEANFSDDMKEKLKNIFSGGGDAMPEVFGMTGSGSGNMLGLVFILVIFTIIFFFGYKLYKSIKDKEIKREEKKKAKLMKKKK